MKTRLGVGIVGAGSVTQAIHLPILATLREQFLVRHIVDVDLSLASEVAARAGARASTDLEALLDDDAVDIGLAHARCWTNALPRMRNDVASSMLLDSVISSARVTDSPLVTAFVEQMAVVRSVVGALHHVDLHHRSVDQYMLTARCGGVLINLTGLVSPRAETSLSMDLVGSSSRWRIRFGDDELARPGEISRFDSQGAESRAPVFESPHRGMWLGLHAAAVNRSRLLYTLDDLAHDLALAAQVALADR